MEVILIFVHLRFFLALPEVPLYGPQQMLGELCGSQGQPLSSSGLCRHPLLIEGVGLLGRSQGIHLAAAPFPLPVVLALSMGYFLVLLETP